MLTEQLGNLGRGLKAGGGILGLQLGDDGAQPIRNLVVDLTNRVQHGSGRGTGQPGAEQRVDHERGESGLRWNFAEHRTAAGQQHPVVVVVR